MSKNENEKSTVLIVDDEPDLLESMARILDGDRIRTVTTTDPLAVIGMIEEHRPDVLLTDFRMPRLNGLDLLKEVLVSSPRLPVIMVSAYATGDGLVEAVRKGAFDYLIKPFSVEVLQVTVQGRWSILGYAKRTNGYRLPVGRKGFATNSAVPIPTLFVAWRLSRKWPALASTYSSQVRRGLAKNSSPEPFITTGFAPTVLFGWSIAPP